MNWYIRKALITGVKIKAGRGSQCGKVMGYKDISPGRGNGRSSQNSMLEASIVV